MIFDKLPYADQKEIVLQLLHEYSNWDFQKREETMKFVVHKGWKYSMGWKECSKRAADFLVKDHTRAMKFEQLVTQMQKMGLESLYYHIMHAHLNEALR